MKKSLLFSTIIHFLVILGLVYLTPFSPTQYKHVLQISNYNQPLRMGPNIRKFEKKSQDLPNQTVSKTSGEIQLDPSDLSDQSDISWSSLGLGIQKYPLESRRLGEFGKVVIEIKCKPLCVAFLSASSGFERLDNEALSAVSSSDINKIGPRKILFNFSLKSLALQDF